MLDIVLSGAGMLFDSSSGNVIVSLVTIGVTVWMLVYISSERTDALFFGGPMPERRSPCRGDGAARDGRPGRIPEPGLRTRDHPVD